MKRRNDALALDREIRDEIEACAGDARIGHVNRHDKGRAARRRGASVASPEKRQSDSPEEVMERSVA